MSDASDDRMTARQMCQGRALQYLTHLEHIDAIKLVAMNAEQEQLKPVIAYQRGALID